MGSSVLVWSALLTQLFLRPVPPPVFGVFANQFLSPTIFSPCCSFSLVLTQTSMVLSSCSFYHPMSG